jgi:hypothetical protein
VSGKRSNKCSFDCVYFYVIWQRLISNHLATTEVYRVIPNVGTIHISYSTIDMAAIPFLTFRLMKTVVIIVVGMRVGKAV